MSIRRTISTIVALALLAAAPFVRASAEDPQAEPIDLAWAANVKAGYLFNLINNEDALRVVTWPAETFRGAESPIVLGFLGEDAHLRPKIRSLAGRAMSGRTIEVRLFGKLPAGGTAEIAAETVKRMSTCHLLFICEDQRDHASKVLAALRGCPVLTVSDTKRFARQGGMIEFVHQDEKIVMHINRAVAERERLRLSSKLLRIARKLYDTVPDEGEEE